MSLSADTLLERMELKKSQKLWRNIAVLALILLGLALVSNQVDIPNQASHGSNHIARISIEGFILQDNEKLAILKNLAQDNKVKAVIVHINSPGGTVVGGESYFMALKKIAAKKPVVAVIGSLGTSGGYMTAIAADYIFAYKGSITGSIGVMMQAAEFTELADKVGVHFNTFKSGDLKGAPSPVEKITPKVAQYMQRSIEQVKDMFVNMVADARNMPVEQVEKFADGRIIMGSEAVKLHLIDAIGDEDNAIAWLQEHRNIPKSIKVIDWRLEKKPPLLDEFISTFSGTPDFIEGMFSGGMLALWSQPSQLH